MWDVLVKEYIVLTFGYFRESQKQAIADVYFG
jgi:hypothetical protein